MLNKIERFIYYWRMPIIFLIPFFVLLFLCSRLEGNAAGIVGALWLFVDIPCLIFFTGRSIYLSIRSAITYHRTGIRDEVLIFPELDFVSRVADSVSEEINSVKLLSLPMKFRYLAFRVLGIVLIVIGIACCFLFSDSFLLLVIFTMVIIAGVTLWILANPARYNSKVEGIKMIPCHDKFTEGALYDVLLPFTTSLGAPRLTEVRSINKPVIVYGSASDAYIYVIYRSRFSDSFYISTLSSTALIDQSSSCEEIDDTCSQEYAFYLNELASVVEEAIYSIENNNQQN